LLEHVASMLLGTGCIQSNPIDRTACTESYVVMVVVTGVVIAGMVVRRLHHGTVHWMLLLLLLLHVIPMRSHSSRGTDSCNR